MSGPAATLLAIENALPIWGGAVALNRDGESGAPDWMQILPAGAVLTGRDGRSWKNPDPARLIAAFNAQGAPIAIDYEHAQDHRAPQGHEAPASGWIETLELRDGATWGRVDWTPKGKASVENREYRFFSPAFTFDRASGEVGRLVGGALVNRPNFVMAALNALAATPAPPTSGPSMLKEIAAALGLPETATAAECVMGIAVLKSDKITALNRQATPDLTLFVPRVEFDTALNRARTAEEKLATLATEGQDKAVNAAVDGAIAAGKIQPAARDFYLATCRQDGGLASFEKHVATLPSLFTPSDLGGRVAEAAGGTALNAEQKTVAKAMGIAEDKFLAFLTAQAKPTA